ncbi:MAG: phosphoglycerate kinase [Planctomycetes bacterium]|nr:phosphoglycerate kinase [Planctomycetota bacterium]
MELRSIEDLGDLRGKRVLLRVDYNVPLAGDRVTDDTRIARSLPTVRELVAAGARVVLMSHLGRPKGSRDPKYSVAPAGRRLAELFGKDVLILPDCVGPALLENLRFHKGEEKNDEAFARGLAELGDVYVNDAFGAAHRAHASVAALAGLRPCAAGRLMQEEISALSRVRDRPVAPLVLVMGGAKVADKIPLIRNFLDRVARVVIGGAMAYTFLAAKGVAIGTSRFEAESVETTREILARAGDRLVLPVDHRCAAGPDGAGAPVVSEGAVPDGLMGLDIGPRSEATFAAAVRGAGTVVWNGPMGVFEKPAFASGTRAVAAAIATLPPGTPRVVGGGDTVAAVESLGFAGKVGHVSTGGGASLEFLGGDELPGVTALRKDTGR